MAALVTADAQAKAIAQHNADPFLALLTVEHPRLAEPIRLVRNFEPVVSRGHTFQAVAMSVALPTDTDEAPTAQVTMGNVSRKVGQALEAMDTPPACALEIVLASDPDTVERSWQELSFSQASWDASTAQVDLSHISYWDEPWPRKRITPAKFPGLFP
jgi:hypothetical protein